MSRLMFLLNQKKIKLIKYLNKIPIMTLIIKKIMLMKWKKKN